MCFQLGYAIKYDGYQIPAVCGRNADCRLLVNVKVAAPQDDAENVEEHGWRSPGGHRHMSAGAAGMDSPWIEKELRALRALCEESKRERSAASPQVCQRNACICRTISCSICGPLCI